jgi:hypothetical protein
VPTPADRAELLAREWTPATAGILHDTASRDYLALFRGNALIPAFAVNLLGAKGRASGQESLARKCLA